MKQNRILGYAASFTAFLLRRLEESSRIDRILLYGSAARNQATKQSDIDIFIDTKAKLEEQIKKIRDDFYDSREALLFKAQGVENEINVKVGELKKWKELHRSIASSGIVLLGGFEAKEKPIGTAHKAVFYWERVGINRGAFLNKIYGYKIKGRSYPGLLSACGGKRIGKSCVVIPAKNKEEMLNILRHYKVEAKCFEAFVLE